MSDYGVEHVEPDDLTETEYERLDKKTEVEKTSLTPHEKYGFTAARYATGTDLYRAVAYDEMGLANRVGDYNAEHLGKSMAEKVAVEAFREETGFDGVLTVVSNRTSLPNASRKQRNNQEHVYYEVAVFMNDPKSEA